MFEAEADALHALIATRSVRVPQPLCSGTAAGQAFLVLEHLDLRGRAMPRYWATQLAQLHRAPQTRFGWARDNWIGSTPQPNGWQRDWIAFWRDQRLGFQLKLAAQNGYSGALQRDGESPDGRARRLFSTAIRLLPSLLHGDLWGGNHGYLPDGAPVIFDPAATSATANAILR